MNSAIRNISRICPKFIRLIELSHAFCDFKVFKINYLLIACLKCFYWMNVTKRTDNFPVAALENPSQKKKKS